MDYKQLANYFTKEKWIDSAHIPKDLFVVLRFLSMYPDTFWVASDATKFQRRLPDWAIASFLYLTVKKKHNAPFIKYISKKKVKDGKRRKELRSLISKHLCCSLDHAEEAIIILERNKVDAFGLFGLKREKK